MKVSRVLEQHIAVFGESGSGKTVMLSSFYGAAQEPQFLKSSPFRLVADDTSQGNRLHKNYLGMRDEDRRPEADRFSSTSYTFSVKLKSGDAKPNSAKQFDSLRLVWHDYPGEWFEQEVSGPQEGRRKVDTFRSLLNSDVALLLADGQRLLDNAGEEDRYLRSLIGDIRNGLLSLKDDLLESGKPLVKFPRIWIVALSKADLLPQLDVFKFRDLVIRHASEDLEELRAVLAELVESSDALAVGEDFVVLSSAKFRADKIDVTERVGLDLILPLAAMLPFERHIRWVEEKRVGSKVVEGLLGGAGALAAAMVGKKKFGGKAGVVVGLIGREAVNAAMHAAVKMAGDKLREKHDDALKKHDYMAAALTGYRLDLERAEGQGVLLRSAR
jgi:hypothetical protein